LLADDAIVVDIYASREKPLPGVTAELVVEAARASGHRRVRYCPDWRSVPALLEPEIKEQDLVLMLGAGDIYQLGQSLVEVAAVEMDSVEMDSGDADSVGTVTIPEDTMA
jgi:UDP-N-acetylmuramate--alanine ligase